MNGNVDLKNKLELLKLYDHLKREIYRSNDLDTLLTSLVKIIANHSMYDSAWILTSKGNVITKFFHSENYNYGGHLANLQSKCFEDTIKANKILIINNKSLYCKDCPLREIHDTNTVFSVPLKHKDKVFGVFLVNVHSQFAGNKEHQDQFVSLSEDISYTIYNAKLEKKLIKEKIKLQKSKENLEFYINNTDQALFIIDFNNNISFASNKSIEILRLKDNLPLKKFIPEDVFSKPDIKRVSETINSLRNSEVDSITNIYTLKSAIGEKFQLQICSRLIRDKNGEPQSVASIIKDITESINKESLLRIAEKKYETIFEKAPNGISILDKKGFIIEVNEKESSLLGYDKKEMIGKHISSFLSPEFRYIFKTKFHKFQNTGVQDVDLEVIRKDGAILKVSRTARAIYNTNKEIVKIIVITSDNTELIEANRKLHIFSDILEQSPSVITITDIQGKITYINKRFSTVTGFSASEVIGEYSNRLKSGAHPNEFYANIWKRITAGKIWKGRFYNKRKDGSLYWEQALISPFYDNSKSVVGYVKVAEDVTSFVALEKKLEESNNRYQHVFNIVPVPIVIHNNDVILDANDAALRFSRNITRNKIIGSNILSFVHPDHHEENKEYIRKLLYNNIPIPRIEQVFYNGYGEERNVEVTSSIINYKGDDAIVTIFEDVTERKNWTKQLEESEYKFRNVFDINPAAISISKLNDGMLLDVNQGYIDSIGYSRDDIIGHTVDELNVYADVKKRDELIEKIHKDGAFDAEEVKFRIKDGSIITGLVYARVIELKGEKLLLFISHDISERKYMETELRHAKEKAEENDVLKTAFLTNMSHEIRTPLNAIIGFSDLLKEDDVSKEEQLYYLDIIQSKGDELLILMNDIIDMSKIEAGALVITKKDVCINKILDDLRVSFSSKIVNKINDKVEITIEKYEGENSIIYVDSFRLIQVLNNLLNNAIKFTIEGQINVKTTQINNSIIIEVSDTGIGIPEDKLEFVFDRFRQIDVRLDTLVGGTGLGLNISNNLIKMMNGKLTATSIEGKGSIFKVELPLC